MINTEQPHIHYPRVERTNKAREKMKTPSVFYLKVTFPQLHHGRWWTTCSRYSGSYLQLSTISDELNDDVRSQIVFQRVKTFPNPKLQLNLK